MSWVCEAAAVTRRAAESLIGLGSGGR